MKVIPISDYLSADPPRLHFEHQPIEYERPGHSGSILSLLNFDFDANPDPAFDSDADPVPGFHSDSDPNNADPRRSGSATLVPDSYTD